jgi:hypothetical protein
MASAIPGATLLRFPWYITLYLGIVEGKPCIILETWAYKKKRGQKGITRLK